MRRGLGSPFVPISLTAGFVVAWAAGALSAPRAAGICLICLAALFSIRLVRDVRAADANDISRRFDAALRGDSVKESVPGELLRMERAIGAGVSTAIDCHRQLLPLLRTAAAARLASAHGIDLARSPAKARARLGDEAWDLLRPDRPVPEDKYAPGLPRERVEQLIAQVEAL